MPNLKEVKNRINSVVSTQQITKAMKMVAASKLRRAQDLIFQLRPYAEKLMALQKKAAKGLDEESLHISHYTLERGINNVLIVVISSDRGLCGAFNNNTFKRTLQLIEDNYPHYQDNGNLTILPIGKKARDFFKRRNFKMNSDYFDILSDVSFDHIKNVADYIMKAFTDKKFDHVDVVFNEFKNAATQILRVEQFLPIISIEQEEVESGGYPTDYIFEPSKKELLSEIIPNSLKIQFYRYILESNASEQGARMIAMDQATENAGELLKQLRLTYNRTRQAAITRELLEIVAGANALEGE